MPHLFCLSNIPSSLPHKFHQFDSSFSLSTLSNKSTLSVSPFSTCSLMIPELEKPRVTEIQVRMDCNGCVQKIKKALHGINGIYDLYIDFPNQKLTIIGWTDPDKIVKAIRKTRKIATICSHIEPTDQSAAPPGEQPEQAPAEGGAQQPPSDAQNPHPTEAPPADATQPPPTEPPKDPPPPENPQPEEKPTSSPVPPDASASQQPLPPGPKDVGEVHVIYQYPPGYGYRYGYGHTYGSNWHRYPNVQAHQPEQPQLQPQLPTQPHPHQPEQPQPVYITHSYNTYRPSPYVTEYQYIHSPPPHTFYNRMDHYSEDYHENSRNGNITSIFSDENPNACSIV